MDVAGPLIPLPVAAVAFILDSCQQCVVFLDSQKLKNRTSVWPRISFLSMDLKEI